MRALISGVAVALLLLGVSAQTVNQRETISIGIKLTLGITEDDAINQLTKAGYQLVKVKLNELTKASGFTSIWGVVDPAKPKNERPLGIIFFTSGHLTYAVRELLPADGNAVNFGRQVYSALRDLELEGNSHCTIHVENKRDADYVTEIAHLTCGKKTVDISLSRNEGRDDETVDLNEDVGTH